MNEVATIGLDLAKSVFRSTGLMRRVSPLSAATCAAAGFSPSSRSCRLVWR
jgi:hypothetical protein